MLTFKRTVQFPLYHGIDDTSASARYSPRTTDSWDLRRRGGGIGNGAVFEHAAKIIRE